MLDGSLETAKHPSGLISQTVMAARRFAILTLEASGVIETWNPAATAIFGWSKAEAIGKPGSLIFVEEDQSSGVFENELIQADRCGGLVYERWLSRRDGSRIWGSGELSPIRVDATLAGFTWILRDGTEQRRQFEAIYTSEARLRLATSAADIGVWEWDVASGEMIYSARAREICGLSEDEPVTFELVQSLTHPEDLPHTLAQAARALDPEIHDRNLYEYRVVRRDGTVRWVRAHGEAVFADGPHQPKAVRYVGTLTDITDRKLVEIDLQQAEASLELAMAAGRLAFFEYNGQGELVGPSPQLNRIIGFPPDAQPTTEELIAIYYPGDQDVIRAAAQRSMDRDEHDMQAEYRIIWPSGEVRWMLLRAHIFWDQNKKPTGSIGVLLDITDRMAAEERLRLLAREVDHRANNLLAVVQSTVALSKAPTVSSLKEILTGRVSALARAHQLLAESRWAGADLRRIVEEELRPYSADSYDRVVIDGERHPLAPYEAQSIAMAIHELSTNAAKYGALSVDQGQVAISWVVDARGLRLRWEERGGPPVTPPTRRGLGTTVLERVLESHPGGGTKLDWRPAGLVCDLVLSLSKPA